MKALALWAIRVYQRMISPRKGFCCAYAFHTSHASCSALGYRAIRRFGVVDGVKVLHSRLHKCGVAHRRYGSTSRPILAGQAGMCDLDCGDTSCDSCDWEWPFDSDDEKKKKKKKRDRGVVLPPRRN